MLNLIPLLLFEIKTSFTFIDRKTFYYMKDFSSLQKKFTLLFTIAIFSMPFLKHSNAQQPCIDNYEPNNEKKNATLILTNLPYFALISTPLDVDWYTFTVTS